MQPNSPPLKSASYLSLFRKWEVNFTPDYSQPSPTLEKDLSSGYPDATVVAKQQGAKQEQNVIVPGREFQVWQQLDCSLGNFAFLAARNSVKEAFLACGS